MQNWQKNEYWLPGGLVSASFLGMAETIRLRVKCHACSNVIEGTAKYGSGHFVPEGVIFEFVAVGKVEGAKGRRVKAEVTCTCPNCGVKCKYNV